MALVAVLFASKSLAIDGVRPARSLATLLAFLTTLIAVCNPSSAVIGSIISVQPFPTVGKQLCGYKHHPSTPTAHSGIQSSYLGWRLPVETPKRASIANAYIMTISK
jgi:hypothetical protein